MDIKQILYFIEVSNTGSFTAAAKRLYLSVPGLVKSMDRLEDELGVSLFVRMRSGVTLTPAGQVLARYAPSYVRKHELMVSNVRKAAAQRETRVEVGMTWGMLSFFPRNFLSRFVLSNPEASLAAHTYSHRELHDALREYRTTIGLYLGEIDDPELEILFHREAPVHVLMSEGNPLCAKETLCMKDLQHAKIVLVNGDPVAMNQMQQRLESVGCAPQIMLDGTEWEVAIELVANAGYISFCMPPRNLRSNSLLTRPVEDMGLKIDFNVAVMKGVAMTEAERRFVSYVVDKINVHHKDND